MQTIDYQSFDERVTKFRLRDRLDVVVIHKPDFFKTYVTLTTPLGSIHHHYRDDEGIHDAPAGIAHFLEHKVFEKNGVDISSEFSRDEAQVNAYTEHTKTTYLFHATAHVFDHITRLLTMFFHPEFTDEGVEKEKSIITEELNMHLDSPHYQQYQAHLSQLFLSHPIRDDILGTHESIQAMTTETLRRMHQAYYRPDVCTLTVVGDIDEAALKNHLEATVTLPEESLYHPHQPLVDEAHSVQEPRRVMHLDLRVPSVLVGIKHMPEGEMTAHQRLKHQLSMTMLYDLVFGKSSDLHEALMDEGLINDSYGIDLQFEATYGYALIGTESYEPERFADRIVSVLRELDTHRIDVNDFNRYKKQILGGFVMSLDSLEYIAHETARHIKDGLLFHDMLDIARGIAFEDILALKQSIDEERMAVTYALPKQPSNKNTP